jgi:membrane-associated phospholipid phosphatase
MDEWTMFALLSAYLFPLTYMEARVSDTVCATGTPVSLCSFFRERYTGMAILVCIFGIFSATILHFLGYSSDLVATLSGVVVVALLITLVGKVYRVSFHLVLLTNTVVPLFIIVGLPSLVLTPFILLLGASRYYLGGHTPPQLITSFLLGLIVSIVVFQGFGMLR